MTDNEFISKTVNEGNTDLEQYPTAKVQQMAKKLESSKVTAKHIKQHTSSMQGATQPQQHKQVNQHQPLPYAKNPSQCIRCGDSPPHTKT